MSTTSKSFRSLGDVGRFLQWNLHVLSVLGLMCLRTSASSERKVATGF